MSWQTVWASVSAISGAVAAIAAFRTVRQSRVSSQEQIRAHRPYFKISHPRITPNPKTTPPSFLYKVQLSIKNIGARPATKWIGQIHIINQDLKTPPEYKSVFSIATDVPPTGEHEWWKNDLFIQDGVPLYIVLAIQYTDPIVKETFSQIFWFQWLGGVEDDPQLMHISVEAKEEISVKLRDDLKQFTCS